ncbi:MAG: MCE family protein [Acidimicrobiales bacterium]|nr:MCE family protein [Acidimicrobiales bacterium]
MRSFTERSPVVLGLVVVVLLGVSVTGALVLNAGVFKGRYSISARFTDAAGLRPGDKVRVAGVAAGEVDSVHEEDGEVEVNLRVDDGVELSGDTRAEVVVETVLGTKSVRLETGDDWDHPLRDGDVITDTGTPVEVLDLQNIGTRFFTESDGRAFDELIDSLEQVTEGKHDDVARIVRGVNRLSGELNARDDEARRLFDAAETLSRTLADRDDDLVVAVDDLNVVVGDLADRRTALHTLLAETAEAAGRLADLAGKRFLYYPLHYEPERALQGISPEYFYQLYCIAALSRDLPAGVLLAVKDQFYGVAARPDNFYAQIKQLKNVFMLDPLERGLEVVKAADAVATICGTSGFEAAALGRPVVAFGRHNTYGFLPHVWTIEDEARLPEVLATVLDESFDGARARADGQRFLNAVMACSFDMQGYTHVKLDSFGPQSVPDSIDALERSMSPDRRAGEAPLAVAAMGD